MRIVVALLVFVSAAGCTRTDPVEVDIGTPVTDVSAIPLGRFDVVGASDYQGTSPEVRAARVEMLSDVMDRFRNAREIMASSRSLERQHAAIISLLADSGLRPTTSWFLDQLVSSMMLERIFATPYASRSSDMAAAYVLRLVERDSPNAPLILRALADLGDHWSQDQIRSVAIRAATAALEYLEDCASCGAATGSRKAEPFNASDIRARDDIRKAAEELSVLAAGKIG